MNFINIYINIIKNKKNYNIIFFNFKHNFLIILNINYNLYLKLNYNLYLKLLKNYVLENGLNILLLENWYKFGIKYNLILKLLS
jgi:hypothetical protein